MIKRVLDENNANYCDKLLEKLIEDEKKYDDTINNVCVKDYFKNIIKNKDNILLVFEENEIIKGYIFLKKISDEIYSIDGLYVIEDYRRCGIGKKLLDEAISILNKMNIKYVDINVLRDNFVAFDLYKRSGFNEFKVNMRKEIY